MSKITPKNLHYDTTLPPFLARLQASHSARDDRHEFDVARPRKKRDANEEREDEPVYVEANDSALRRMLLLLLDNAVKYTPSGGRITMTVDGGPEGATLAVRDTGIGISETALPHIFERFYRVDESRNRDAGGTGLGLSIAKWIAERHHASLEAESVVGQGSVFRIRFPLA